VFYRKGSPLSPVKGQGFVTPPRKCWESHEDSDGDLEIDVEEVEPETQVPYEATKAKNLMMQCEKHAAIMKSGDADDKWESQIMRYDKGNIVNIVMTVEGNVVGDCIWIFLSVAELDGLKIKINYSTVL
jgi:hypothetical protein